MKKSLVLFILMLATVFTLVACTDSNEDPEDITITYWHTYGDSEEAVLLDIVMPLWNALHPEITVDVVRQDGSQYHEMIVTSFGTGNGPDVARIDISNTASYAAEGGLVALDTYDDFDTISQSFLEGPLSTSSYKGSYYGLPLDTNCKAAVVNLNLLESELGLTEVPETMEEFITAAATRGEYSLNVSGVGDWDLYPYFWLFGGMLTNEDFTQATGYLNSQDSIDSINKMKDLRTQNIFTIRDIDGTADAWAGIQDEYVMFFEGPWYGFSGNIVAATIPTYEGRSASVVGGENIAVFTTSDNQDAAYEFAKFMTTESVQLAMLTVGQLPILKSLVTNSLVLANPKWSVYMKQLETASARIPSPNNDEIKTIWSNAMTEIFLNGANVTTTLNAAAAAMDAELE
jgi:multiple sugar transport system substrate-binding protein